MCSPKFKKESYKKKFFRKNNPLLVNAKKVMNTLYGTNEEKLGQLEMVIQTEQFQRKYPGLLGKDVAFIIRQQLSKY